MNVSSLLVSFYFFLLSGWWSMGIGYFLISHSLSFYVCIVSCMLMFGKDQGGLNMGFYI